jgi:RimJ/RimL family protein N-acetyltransferase
MLELERATTLDVPALIALERAADTKPYIIPYSDHEHERNMADPALVYLRIVEDGLTAGFFILALDGDGTSVEFRRIVVSAKDRGLGQLAIARMEGFCRTQLGRSRIWLDVFEHNARGRHIYEKLGYKKYMTRTHDNGSLWLYEKSL